MLNVGERFRPHVPLNSSHRSELAPPPDVDSVGVSRSLDDRGLLSLFFMNPDVHLLLVAAGYV